MGEMNSGHGNRGKAMGKVLREGPRDPERSRQVRL
jgi:hypothetical protein